MTWRLKVKHSTTFGYLGDVHASYNEARISPLDIEAIKASQRAEVRFPSFKARDFPVIFGKVRSISSDRFTDETNGQPYFLALIEVDDSKIEGAHERLTAGLPAEVIVPTG